MNKNEIIKQVRNAYVDVISFKNAVQKWHLGLDVESEILQQDPTESAFGKWFYHEGQYLNQLKSYQEIEEFNEKQYRICQAIYKLAKESTIKDWNNLLVLNTKKNNINKKNLINAYCKDFLKANNKLAMSVRKLYNEVVSLPDVCFRADKLVIIITTT